MGLGASFKHKIEFISNFYLNIKLNSSQPDVLEKIL